MQSISYNTILLYLIKYLQCNHERWVYREYYVESVKKQKFINYQWFSDFSFEIGIQPSIRIF